MNIFQFIRILFRKAWVLILLPAFTGMLVFLLTQRLPAEYQAELTLFTGITSSTGIENMEGHRVDYFATQNAYNNILSILQSRSVLEEVAIRLLTTHLMLDKPHRELISEKAFSELQELVPGNVKRLIIKTDFEQSCRNITDYITQEDENFIYGLLHYDHPHYSLKALSGIESEHLGSSDIIRISYRSDDPGSCYQTLNILMDVFMEKYQLLKNKQSGSAVIYFEEKLKSTAASLDQAEEDLMRFNTRYNIINYYEQTKHISSQQEKIEVTLQKLKMENRAAIAVLKKLESETQIRYDINLSNREILSVRNELITLNNKLARLSLLSLEEDRDEVELLSREKTLLEFQLQSRIDSLYVFESNSQGLEIQKMLTAWLNALKDNESSRARLVAMEERKEEFSHLYQQYAPLGARLSRIEREIEVKEAAYLEVLHHLGLARLRQQNASLLSNMKILDIPVLPINALESKRKLYVIIAVLFSALFYILGLFILELLDRRIRTPEKLLKFSGLEVIAGFCRERGTAKQTYLDLSTRAQGYISEKIHLLSAETQASLPITIHVYSLWNGEGKTHIIGHIVRKLQKTGGLCEYIDLADPDSQPNGSEAMNLSNPALNTREPGKLLNAPADYLIIECPPLSDGIQDPANIKKADVSLLVVDSSRTWQDVDRYLLQKLSGVIGNNLYAVLNQAIPEDLSGIVGEIPRNRSLLRSVVKQRLMKRFI